MAYLFQCGRFDLPIGGGHRPLVMGILNVTADSFSDGGRFLALPDAIDHAEKMIDDGVDIIDIGGESTRPGSSGVSIQQELDRVMPVIYALRDCGKPLSVDTSKPEVMREAIAAGADMINDINALRSPGAIDAVKGKSCGLCIMHMQGAPNTMQQNPTYHDVVSEVTAFLKDRVGALEAAGIDRSRICVDPGFGFGKTLQHNLQLLKKLSQIQQSLELPLLAGLSRKASIGAITGRGAQDRMAGSVAAALMAVTNGAGIVRVHDVAETVDALKVWQAVTH